jgi:presenilin-like A22 family membrane protease
MKSNMGANHMSTTDFPALVFVFWPNIILLEVLCVKLYHYDAKSIYKAKDLIFFNDFAAINVPKYGGRMLG